MLPSNIDLPSVCCCTIHVCHRHRRRTQPLTGRCSNPSVSLAYEETSGVQGSYLLSSVRGQ
ncbi:hypothetical protein M9458_008047, partial [Cirrhinus mrigala]